MHRDASELQSLLLYVTVFWAVVHVLHYIFLRRHPSTSVLPPPSSSPPSRVARDVPNASPTQINLHKLSLSIQSTAFRASHDSLSATLSNPARSRTRIWLVHFYNLGSMLGFAGMLGSFVLLVWTTFHIARFMLNNNSANPANVVHAIHKRATEYYAEHSAAVKPAKGGPIPIHMIIPGLTVPARHLPILVFALIISQIIHEAGHAVAAAIQRISLLSVGLSLTVIVPSAFVVLPSVDVSALLPAARLRIIAAGAFHNILFWLVLQGLNSFHISSLVWSVGYHDVQSFGRVVAGIDAASPLVSHVPIGSVVVKLDDQWLSTNDTSVDIWNSYLSDDERMPSSNDLGWCVERLWFIGQPTSCCSSRTDGHSEDANLTLSCFTTLDHPAVEGCVDPLLFFDPSSISMSDAFKRCDASIDCGESHRCVRSRSDQELLRMTLHIPSWLRPSEIQEDGRSSIEKVIVWNGPREEVFEAVEASRWLPRNSYISITLPLLCDTFFSYLSMMTLALYFFNLLPLPFLDGAQFLDALLDFSAARPSPSIEGHYIEMDELESGRGQAPIDNGNRKSAVSKRWKERVTRMLQIVLWSLISFCAFGGLVQEFW